MEDTIYDLMGIGIGPFNLGLAALISQLRNFKTIFIDKRKCFDWHPGMMMPGTTLQVPFYADLVTLADPCSPYSFMCFLKATGRLFPFATKENNYISRKEYNQYCKWVIAQLQNLYFGYSVHTISFDEKMNCYKIITTGTVNKTEIIYYSMRIVLGTGTSPFIPDAILSSVDENIFHSAEYLFRKNELLSKNSITVIGSGQSAAEIFYDLLQNWHTGNKRLNWFTRSERFFPMDVSKLSCELSTPDYIDYFYNLNPAVRKKVLQEQHHLFKGINSSLLQQIYDLLYDKLSDNEHEKINLMPNCELQCIEKNSIHKYLLSFFHREEAKMFHHSAEAVILSTGYKYAMPSFLEHIHGKIKWTPEGLYDVSRYYTIDIEEQNIFVQNAEMHTHGFTAPDLGLGTHRNAVILNKILGYEHFEITKCNTFQQFSIMPG